MAGFDLPLKAIREQISSALDVVVQLERMRDGTRKWSNVSEVQGMEGDVIITQEVFKWEGAGIKDGKVLGFLKSTGIRPKFIERIEATRHLSCRPAFLVWIRAFINNGRSLVVLTADGYRLPALCCGAARPLCSAWTMSCADRISVIDTRLDRYAGRQADPSPARRGTGSGRFDGLVNEQARSVDCAPSWHAPTSDSPRGVCCHQSGDDSRRRISWLIFLPSPANFVFALIGGVIGFYVPRFYVRFLQGRRLNAFNNQLGDTIVLLSNALRSGYSLLQSMETASKELSTPMSGELARVTREVGLGLTHAGSVGEYAAPDAE